MQLHCPAMHTDRVTLLLVTVMSWSCLFIAEMQVLMALQYIAKHMELLTSLMKAARHRPLRKKVQTVCLKRRRGEQSQPPLSP